MLLPAPVPHLDRVFDYAVAEHLRQRSLLGCRVRVRFAGRLVTGIVVREQDSSDFQLQPIKAVLGPAVVPTQLAELTQAVAQRYVGNWSDVVTAAVPPRHARAEKTVLVDGAQLPPPLPVASAQAPNDAGDYVTVGMGRFALSLPWSWDWTLTLSHAIAATLSRGQRVLVVVPDEADMAAAMRAVDRLDRPVTVAQLGAGVGPYARYRAYLRALAGQVDVVIGTRAAAFVPLPDLGLLWLWRDGDTALSDPQSPYWHAREVVGMRAQQQQVASVVFANYTRSTQVQRLVEIGWLTDRSPGRVAWRADVGRVRLPDVHDQARDPAALTARLPHAALDVVRTGLASGPVLVQVPRRGYVPLIACEGCRCLLLCPVCAGAARLNDQGRVECRRCVTVTQDWRCAECGHHAVRAVRVGAGRTAVELARAFPDVPVLRSDADVGVRTEVDDEPSLVVATPGAEPKAVAGYAAALLLDGDVLAHAPWLHAPEEALDRWCAALSGLRPNARGMLVAHPMAAPAQALVRADPVGFAQRELLMRTEAALPPAVRMFAVTGSEARAVAEQSAAAVSGTTALGPVPGQEGPRWYLRADYRNANALAHHLDGVRRERSQQRLSVVSIRADPTDMGG